MDIVLVLIGLLLVAGLILAYVTWRWRVVLRRGGIEVALRWRSDKADRGWHRGIGQYHGEEFAWYRVSSFRRRPDRILHRARLRIVERRDVADDEAYALPAGATVLHCRHSSGSDIDIALAPGALIGFLSWLEAAPPGRRLPRAS